MRVGFTGTRNGLTAEQKLAFVRTLVDLGPNLDEFHHGACVGADEDATKLVYDTLAWTGICAMVAHPGRGAKDTGESRPDRSQSAIYSSHEVREERSHFARNRMIVESVDVLIACPPRKPLPSSGGTAYTVNYAWKMGKPVIVIWPDGSTEE